MKTPISSILMGIQILETGKLDTRPEKRAKLFHILKDESEHLLALTEKVLTLSKLENHQLNLFREMLSLRSMLDDLIEKFSAKADKPVHFSLALEAETVVADGEFLKEAISNLIDNAIKYSGASVAITISSFCKPDGAVVIKVKDNGFGIPLKDQSRIFEKYERASATERSRKGGASGFGLGLNYVFRVAEAHGGTVEVESIEGEYSEIFSFSASKRVFGQCGRKSDNGFGANRKKIGDEVMVKLLLVEDDANLCYIIRGGLEDMIGGYEVTTAADGGGGVENMERATS